MSFVVIKAMVVGLSVIVYVTVFLFHESDEKVGRVSGTGYVGGAECRFAWEGEAADKIGGERAIVVG